jgi:hypothetical protein
MAKHAKVDEYIGALPDPRAGDGFEIFAVKGLVLVVLALVAAGCGGSHRSSSSSTASTPSPRTNYSANVTNPWFPLRPGAVWVYRGVKDGEPSRDIVRVTSIVRVIDGAPTVGVSDRLYLSGRLEERTTDYYTQDDKGNVWYFGEDTAELDKHGNVKTTEGSWLAGVNGAKPGIFMYATPKVGQSARQEFLKGQAEDHFEVLRLGAAVHVPYGSSKQALLTKEWTPLEPAVLDHKFYLRGVGTVLEQTVKGGHERNELVSYRAG